MNSIFSSIIRTAAFAKKEIIEIRRQPRLLLTLILAPFLALVIFVLGHRNEERSLRAFLVATKNSPAHEAARKYAPRIGPQLSIVGISDNLNEGKRRLKEREVDVVFVVPDRALEAARKGEKTSLNVLHNEIDPDQSEYVRFVGELAADKLSYWMLVAEMEKKKSEAAGKEILVPPVTSKSVNIAQTESQTSQFFMPAMIVLLLQHLAVSLASLSLIREFRRSGAAEVFRISPLRPLELMIGKYLDYFLIGGVIAFLMTAGFHSVLKISVPIDWRHFAIVFATLLFTSLAIGFTFSMLAKSESQAIQYTMILLLVSVLFSGFVLNLQGLWEPIRFIAWILPATYGVRMAQDVLLRGNAPDLLLVSLLFTMGAYFVVVSVRMLRKKILVAE